ncbi:MAG: hypothetical protein CMJ70_09795 [Planctomycetaceae bacterium]|nr:hypothetical protein [Planctomycetaceae bacterium]
MLLAAFTLRYVVIPTDCLTLLTLPNQTFPSANPRRWNRAKMQPRGHLQRNPATARDHHSQPIGFSSLHQKYL